MTSEKEGLNITWRIYKDSADRTTELSSLVFNIVALFQKYGSRIQLDWFQLVISEEFSVEKFGRRQKNWKKKC